MECPLRLPSADGQRRSRRGKATRGRQAVRRLQEDPTIDFHRDSETGEQILAGITQIHVEVIVDG